MIRESGKYIEWFIFPSSSHLAPSCRKGYLQVAQQKNLWTHVRQPFLTYIIDLTIGPEGLWQGYAPKLRQHIRHAKREDIQIERDQDPTAVVKLFNPIAREKELNIIRPQHLQARPNLLITRAQHPKWGVLAAHAYQLDEESGKVKGVYNASAFREFTEPKVQALCSHANAYLYHADFAYFHTEGFQIYDFSGYGQRTQGANFFKERFRGQVVTQYNYTPIWYFCLRRIGKRIREMYTELRIAQSRQDAEV